MDWGVRGASYIVWCNLIKNSHMYHFQCVSLMYVIKTGIGNNSISPLGFGHHITHGY